VDVPEYGVRAKRGDFEPPTSEISSIACTILRARTVESQTL
jgi:hypothetical protein